MVRKVQYTEIFELKEMLEGANIPFVYTNESFMLTDLVFEKHHIEYPCSWQEETRYRVCSVIQGRGTYGAEQNLLEIMGLLTEEEQKNDCVAGWLTAEDVFNRIKEHYEGSKIE